MIVWLSRFQTRKPMSGFPILHSASEEVRFSPNYHHEGRFRQAERQIVFKYTIEGKGIFRDSCGEHVIEKGRGFLCKVNDPETAYYYDESFTDPWRFVYVTFLGPAAEKMTRNLIARYGPVFELAESGIIVKRLLELRRYSGEEVTMLNASRGSEIVCSVFHALAESRETFEAGSVNHVLVEKALAVVDKHLRDPFNATDLSHALSVSREHLSRVFRDELNITPHDYITRRKILGACELLKDTSLRAKEVASELGFDSHAHFTRTFKRIMQMTPTRFRAVGSVPTGLV